MIVASVLLSICKDGTLCKVEKSKGLLVVKRLKFEFFRIHICLTPFLEYDILKYFLRPCFYA